MLELRCAEHPTYEGVTRAPRGDCHFCWSLYRSHEERRKLAYENRIATRAAKATAGRGRSAVPKRRIAKRIGPGRKR